MAFFSGSENQLCNATNQHRINQHRMEVRLDQKNDPNDERGRALVFAHVILELWLDFD